MTQNALNPPSVAKPVHELAFLFGSIESHARDVLCFVDALRELSGGALLECDIGTSSTCEHFVCVARFDGPLREAAARRVDFWAWRLGATISHDEGRGRAALRTCTLIHRGVLPGLLADAARVQLERSVGSNAARPWSPLTLRLGLARPDAAGLVIERDGRAIFVPSPRQPPVGDTITLELLLAGGEVVAAEGVVTALRDAGWSAPGTPAGFVVELVTAGEPLASALEAARASAAAPEQRRAPRYPVRANATVVAQASSRWEGAPRASSVPCASGGPENDTSTWVENLSQGGAFVRTPVLVPAGTKVRLEVDLPGGVTTRAPGTVVHSNERGMGIHFEADPATVAEIGSALVHVTAHRRRALVVDDDLLSRRMMGAALAAQGFDVYYAADGMDGLHALIDLLLDLHLLVVDVHMPGLDGEQLVRRVRESGGERELTIVVMSGDSDPIVRQLLGAAGADAILTKSSGMASIAEAAVRTMLRRERSRRWQARAGVGRLA